MFCIGCEMVGADHRADEWRALIAQVRARYHGPVTYNCDKYQEGNVTWWDAVDVISASGYYPVDELDAHYRRIEAVAEKFGKPFMFMESGCPSREGSEYIPNNWDAGGAQSNEPQRKWYAACTEALLQHPAIRGVVWWDWSATHLYRPEFAPYDNSYALYEKPAAAVLRDFTRRLKERGE